MTEHSVPVSAADAGEGVGHAPVLIHQLCFVIQHAIRNSIAVPIVIAVIGVACIPSVGWPRYTAWAASTLAAFGIRALLLRPGMRISVIAENPRRWIKLLFASTWISGIITGSAPFLFFPALEPIEQMFLTMIICCMVTGATASLGAHLVLYASYAGIFMVQLILAWLITGNAHASFVAILLLLYGLIMIGFAANFSREVMTGVTIRFENQELMSQLVAARREAEAANAAKSQFLAAASHDLRQPLHALSLYSAALKLRSTDPASAEIAARINEALESTTALVDSLLDISKLDAGAVRPESRRVSVKALIERIHADYLPIASEKGLSFRASPEDVHVESDPALLEQVLRNLVDNAFKYTSVGGVTLYAKPEEHTVRIAVEDTGPGIHESERERIFQEFYQVGNPERDRTQGLGLGLAIVRRLTRLLGIELHLESVPGRGSTFAVTIPRAAGEPVAPKALAQPADARERTLAGARVLVIDDEPSVRAGMLTLLESWGCRVRACGGYDEVQQQLDDDASGFDLIIADFRLRQNENGIETVRRLRARLGPVPALIISGDTAPERLREAKDSGLPFLHKPVAVDMLRQRILDLLRP